MAGYVQVSEIENRDGSEQSDTETEKADTDESEHKR